MFVKTLDSKPDENLGPDPWYSEIRLTTFPEEQGFIMIEGIFPSLSNVLAKNVVEDRYVGY